MGRRSIMASGNNNEKVENLGSFSVNGAFNFKEALKKAKKHPADCGIFAYIEQIKKEKKENK
jgi:hypothetical protein